MRDTTGFSIKATWRRSRIALALALLAGGLSCAWCLAQNAPSAAPATAAAAPAANATNNGLPAALPHPGSAPAKAGVGTKPARKPESRLAWASLSAPQQQALDPLAAEWPKMNDAQKEKWLVIGKKYAQMKPAEQQRLHDRMRDWVKLTPAQRSDARTNYARAKKLDAEEKNEQWSKYQQLSLEQKKKLAQAKQPKRVAKLPTAPGSAAPAIQLPAEALNPAAPAVAPIAPAAPGSQAAPSSIMPATQQAVGAIVPVAGSVTEAAK